MINLTFQDIIMLYMRIRQESKNNTLINNFKISDISNFFYLNVKTAPLSVSFLSNSSLSFFLHPFNKTTGAFSTISLAYIKNTLPLSIRDLT
jgi:hypothetical protein